MSVAPRWKSCVASRRWWLRRQSAARCFPSTPDSITILDFDDSPGPAAVSLLSSPLCFTLPPAELQPVQPVNCCCGHTKKRFFFIKACSVLLVEMVTVCSSPGPQMNVVSRNLLFVLVALSWCERLQQAGFWFHQLLRDSCRKILDNCKTCQFDKFKQEQAEADAFQQLWQRRLNLWRAVHRADSMQPHRFSFVSSLLAVFMMPVAALQTAFAIRPGNYSSQHAVIRIWTLTFSFGRLSVVVVVLPSLRCGAVAVATTVHVGRCNQGDSCRDVAALRSNYYIILRI